MKNKITKQKNLALAVFGLFLLAGACGADRVWAVDTDQSHKSSGQQDQGLSVEEMDRLHNYMNDYTIGALIMYGQLRQDNQNQSASFLQGSPNTSFQGEDQGSEGERRDGEAEMLDNEQVINGNNLNMSQTRELNESDNKVELQSEGGDSTKQPTLCLTEYNNLVDKMSQENVKDLLKKIGWTDGNREKEWLKLENDQFFYSSKIIDVIKRTNKLNRLINQWGDGDAENNEHTAGNFQDEYWERWRTMREEIDKLGKQEFELSVYNTMNDDQTIAITMNLAELAKSIEKDDLNKRALIYMMIMVSVQHPAFFNQCSKEFKENIKNFQEKLKQWTEWARMTGHLEIAEDWENSVLGKDLDNIVMMKPVNEWIEMNKNRRKNEEKLLADWKREENKWNFFINLNADKLEQARDKINMSEEYKEEYKRWLDLLSQGLKVKSLIMWKVIEIWVVEKQLELLEDALDEEAKTLSKKFLIRHIKYLESLFRLKGANIEQTADFEDTDNNEQIESIMEQIKESDLYALVETAKNCVEGIFVKIDKNKKSDLTVKKEDGGVTKNCIVSAGDANIKREIKKKFPNSKFDDADNQTAIEKLKIMIEVFGSVWDELNARNTLKALTECVYEEEESQEDNFFKDKLWKEIVEIDEVLKGRLYDNVSGEIREKVTNLCEEWLNRNNKLWVDKETKEVINEWNMDKSYVKTTDGLIYRIGKLNKFDEKIKNNKSYKLVLLKDIITKMIDWENEYMGEMDPDKRSGDVVFEKTEGDDQEVERKYQLAKQSIVGKMIDAEEKENKEVEDFVQETLEKIGPTRQLCNFEYDAIKSWAKSAYFERKWGKIKGLKKIINYSKEKYKIIASNWFNQHKKLKKKISGIWPMFFHLAIKTMWDQKDEKFKEICMLFFDCLDCLDLKNGKKVNEKEDEIRGRIEKLWREMLEEMEAEERREMLAEMEAEERREMLAEMEAEEAADGQKKSASPETKQDQLVINTGVPASLPSGKGGAGKGTGDPVATTAVTSKIMTAPVATASTKVDHAIITATPASTKVDHAKITAAPATKTAAPVATKVGPETTTAVTSKIMTTPATATTHRAGGAGAGTGGAPASQSGPTSSGGGGAGKGTVDLGKKAVSTKANETPATTTAGPASQSGPASSGGGGAGTSTKTLTKKKGRKKPQGTKKIAKKTKRIAKKPKGRGKSKRGMMAKKKRLRKRG